MGTLHQFAARLLSFVDQPTNILRVQFLDIWGSKFGTVPKPSISGKSVIEGDYEYSQNGLKFDKL